MWGHSRRRTSGSDWIADWHTRRRTSYPSCFQFRTSCNAWRLPSRRQMAKYRAWTGQLIDANLGDRPFTQFRRERVELLTARPCGEPSAAPRLPERILPRFLKSRMSKLRAELESNHCGHGRETVEMIPVDRTGETGLHLAWIRCASEPHCVWNGARHG